jgi:hypothetical protein
MKDRKQINGKAGMKDPIKEYNLTEEEWRALAVAKKGVLARCTGGWQAVRDPEISGVIKTSVVRSLWHKKLIDGSTPPEETTPTLATKLSRHDLALTLFLQGWRSSMEPNPGFRFPGDMEVVVANRNGIEALKVRKAKLGSASRGGDRNLRRTRVAKSRSSRGGNHDRGRKYVARPLSGQRRDRGVAGRRVVLDDATGKTTPSRD